MQIEGLIPFKSFTNQAIASLYFLRISSSLCSSSTVNAADLIIGFTFLCLKKAYFKYLGNSFKVNPSELVSISFALSLLMLDFSVLFSFKLKIVYFKSHLEFRNSQSSYSRYWKFISFSLIEF